MMNKTNVKKSLIFFFIFHTINFAVVWMAPKREFAVLVCTNQGGPAAQKACDVTTGKLIQFYLKNK